MNSVYLYELAEEIPVYIFNDDGTVQRFEIENHISDDTPEWVEQNQRTGKLGENIALTYLKEDFPDISPAENDRKGFDLEANGTVFEVKTSTTDNETFFISINELGKANKLQTKYNIFYIEINETKRTASGYRIQNPLYELGIVYSELTKEITSNDATFSPSNYRVEMGNYLTRAKKIDLSKIYQEIIARDF